MKIRPNIECPYCRAQGITMRAEKQKQPALIETNTRYGCENGHFFAVATKDVTDRDYIHA